MCSALSGAAVVRAMEISAGLRCSDGSERIRVRSALPSVQAVVVVNVVNVCSWSVSWVVRTLGWVC